MIAKAQAATRQLAKRQITWIRGMNNLHLVSCDTLDVHSQATQILNTFHEQTPNRS